MIPIHRPSAGRFRAVARRCVVGRPRGPSPPVQVTRSAKSVTLWSSLGEVSLALTMPSGAGPTETLEVPGSLLDEIASARDAVAEIEAEGSGGRCVWDGRESRWPSIPETMGDRPTTPKTMKSVGPALLAALHECGRSAANDSVRYALKRVQLQGKSGKVVGTDGRQLLIWGTFPFPFMESVLIPAIPVFGCRELAESSDIRIGCSQEHVVVTVGPWTVWLAIDREGRFPDVASVVPGSFQAELEISECDRQQAVALLRSPPAPEDDSPSVTIDVGDRTALRVRSESERNAEIVLVGSKSTGESVAALNREQVLRALTLGFNRLALASNNGPVVFQDADRLYVITTLPSSRVLTNPATTSSRVAPATVARPLAIARYRFQQGDPMPAEGRIPAEATTQDDGDFLAEAEGLRDALGEVARRAARLVGMLKHLQKQRRVLETAWSSLKNLRLGS